MEKGLVLEELRSALKLDDEPVDPSAIKEQTAEGDNEIVTPIDENQKQINVNTFLKMKE